MTDPSVERGSSKQDHDNIEDAVVVDETESESTAATTAAPLVEPDVESSSSAGLPVYDDATVEAEAEPLAEPTVAYEPEIVAEAEPVTADTTSPTASDEPRVVYVTAPTPPKISGNRGFGVFIALASTLAFAIVFAIAVVIIEVIDSGVVALGFVQAPSFYVPIAFFALGAIIIALIVNRAGWAAHVFSSIVVGLVVYFGTIGALLLINGVIQNTPDQAQVMFAAALGDPRVIAAGLLGREVSLWTGALVAKRGRKVTERNRVSRAEWEAELAEKSAAQR
ncbi:hypothetical protein [Salinibacterium sp. M195]|uniref:hypothetical protein n=1 Tax=Salinibacterium sp. M195 TaxID=2583374 RepID=UPI001C637AEA|nr:hypothetical protein [Salinibacterium sp. M195]QYH35334.1 hypothetical protein FFT87_04855 [Salinibacterium sp. M195]